MKRKLLAAALVTFFTAAIFAAGIAYTMHSMELYWSDDWAAANLHGYVRLVENED